MIDLAGYSFDPGKACIVCEHVIKRMPVLAVAHDADGDLHFACGEQSHIASDWHIVGLNHLNLNALGLVGMPTVDPGFAALRGEIESAWEIVPVD